ncbi:putative reverse transcriptase domain-containing protein [Tanacetum coccineum]
MRSVRVHLLPLLDPLEALEQTMDSLALWIMRLGVLVTDDTELGRRITEFATMVRQDTYEIYGRLDEAQDSRAGERLDFPVRSGDGLWHACSEVMALRTTVLGQQAEIADLRAADRARQAQLVETLRLKMAPKRATRSTPATTTTITFVTNAQLKALIDQGVANALAARDVERSRNGEDRHDSGTGVRRQAPPARECTYPDFMKCKPLYFKGTKGVIKLTQWFERMEIWNSHVKTVGHDVAHAMNWTNLKKKMTDKYCPRGEIKKLEVEMIFPEESDKIEKYVGGLPDMIHGSVMASKPNIMQDAIEFATVLIDKKIHTFAKRQSKNKRKQDDNQQQQQNKRQNTGRVYTAGFGENKPYGGSKPLCSKCNYHHDGQCAPKCHKCNRVGHLARNCRSTSFV